ncbi:MAG: hypothetical protein R3D71_08905 [Rickettsiales bacterium]
MSPDHGQHSDTSDHHHDYKQHKHYGALLKTGLVTSGVIITPYVGEALKLSGTSVNDIMHSFHSAGHGSGLAGLINGFMGNIPVVGETLAEGGIATAASSGIIGIGGVLLGNYLEKKEKEKDVDDKKISWGKIIKYAALATSALIALPSILTGISVGISYIASFAGAEVAASVMSALSSSIGTIGEMHMASAASGLGSAFTHLITCGGAALSVTGAMYASEKAEQEITEHANHNGHIDLQNNIDKHVSTNLVSNPKIEIGKETELSFQLKDSNGRVLTGNDLKESFTEKLHVLIIDKSMKDFHHIHPVYDENTGLFTASFTPKSRNSYDVWADYTLIGSGQNIIAKNSIPSSVRYDVSPNIQHMLTAEKGDIEIELDANPPLSAGEDTTLKVSVKSKSGKAIKLDEILGAKAHLVGFNRNGESLVHSHPIDSYEASGATNLRFHVKPDMGGATKFFLQMKIDGKETVIPFGQYIRPEQKIAERDNVRSNYNAGKNNLGGVAI